VPATAYPPPDHILRDLGIRVEVPSATTARARIPATDHVAGADGGVRVGVLAVLVDLAAGAAAVRSLHPDWMATADLTVQLARPASGPWVEARAAVLRRGRTTLVAEIGIFDVDGPTGDPPDVAAAPAGPESAGEQVGIGTLTMAVLPARPGGMRVPPDRDVPVGWSFGDAGLTRPLVDAIDVRVLDPKAGRLSMPLVPYVHNSFGAAQGGVMALLAELSGLTAVESATAGLVGPDAVTGPAVARGLQVAYLALGRVGPVTARAPLVIATPDGGGRAVVELADEGAGDRLTTVVNVDVAATVPAGALP
jgi:uncharacterized protein (TIGR00369 family)